MTLDRAGNPITVGDFVGVLPHNTRDDATVEEAMELGIEFGGTVIALDGDYVQVSGDEPGRGTVKVRRDLVLT
jgi:hypothetical protein